MDHIVSSGVEQIQPIFLLSTNAAGMGSLQWPSGGHRRPPADVSLGCKFATCFVSAVAGFGASRRDRCNLAK
jgi:hypothetical protein